MIQIKHSKVGMKFNLLDYQVDKKSDQMHMRI